MDKNFTRAIKRKTMVLSLLSMLLALNSWSVIAQELRVSGTVIDQDQGTPLPGVTVLTKGSTVGTTTDVDGKYSIALADENSVLVFSFIGFKTSEIQVAGRSVIDVSMALDITALEEVVVIGYGEQRRSDLTGAISSVKSEDIKNLPAATVADAIQGRVAGVFVTASDGAPGSQPNINIRGPGNLTGVQPLYVVDGMPFFGTGFNFNIQDIESMEVIKDASAAAIYGAQASGGVILITTKKGSRSQKIQAGLNVNYGVRNVFNLPDLLDRDQYIRAQVASGVPQATFDADTIGANTDWFDEVYDPAIEQNYTAYLSGGSQVSNFYASFNYQNVEGTRVGNSINRYTLRFNSDHKLSNWLTVGQTIYGGFIEEDPASPPNQGELSFRNSPLVPVRDATNPLGGWGRDNGSQRGNVIGEEWANVREDETYTLNTSAYLEVEIVDGLKLRSNFGANLQNYNRYFFDRAFDFGLVQRVNETFGRRFTTNRQLLMNYLLTYNKTFGDHTISALAGYEARRDKFSSIEGDFQNPLGDLVQDSRLSANAVPNSLQFTGRDNFRILSQFGRLSYSFAGKYLAQVNIRRDGVASVFGPGNKYGTFPSMSLGWRISDEDFINIPAVSNLKLRFSLGELGNFQGVGEFLFEESYQEGFVTDFGGGLNQGFGLSDQLPNRDIRWETIRTTNIGLDIGLFEEKLSLSIDAYKRTTSDVIYQVPLPATAGLGDEVQLNIGELENMGLEFFAEYRDNIGEVQFSVGVNGAFNQNELVTLDPSIEDQQIFGGRINEVYSNAQPLRSVPGEPLGQFYGYIVDGVYQTDQPTGPTVNGDTPLAGDLIYRDLNDDGIINDEDRDFIGNPWPKLTYGITLNAAWKGFDLRMFFNGVQGVDIYNGTRSFEHMLFNDYNTTAEIFRTSGFDGNEVTNLPRPTLRNWGQVSDFHVQDGSFLRLKNLQIGYQIPRSVLDNVKISSARVFVMADNLFTITAYEGIDPEIPMSGEPTDDGPLVRDRGIDKSTFRYPLSRLFSLGLNIEF
ncbi:MAG: TonB-dependent receptor [Cyclobacteriaceae bacterium]|nr:TonB-dependent receptor [Cyclobacteriaceae bacterium HetDA_MAG_MS6]